ncbi:hypothetical protein CHARACLAT_011621 [Characodon lateralis]|uniref:Uncharacterized protein n=1 Tax=Characodon lateralis TaxID=208331 RepID=A0ABU7E8U7_9TELE|nr:hypothetical protein [Characodon lateralis]
MGNSNWQHQPRSCSSGTFPFPFGFMFNTKLLREQVNPIQVEICSRCYFFHQATLPHISTFSQIHCPQTLFI